MKELVKFVKGGASLTQDKKGALETMAGRLGISSFTTPTQSNIRRIALVFDATGSMSGIWRAAKAGIVKLLKRQRELNPQAAFVMIAYRDYCDGNRILEVSKPSTNEGEILEFLDGIVCDGGGDTPEAVEAALERVIGIHPDLAILVGDAPPHGVSDRIQKGDYREYARTLGTQHIPVYTVTTNTDRDTVSSFQEIAELSGGKRSHLNDVNDLIDVLSMATARKADQLDQLSKLLERENRGRLTKKQEILLLEARRQ